MPAVLKRLSVVTADAEKCVRDYKLVFTDRNDAMCAHWRGNRGYGFCKVKNFKLHSQKIILSLVYRLTG